MCLSCRTDAAQFGPRQCKALLPARFGAPAPCRLSKDSVPKVVSAGGRLRYPQGDVLQLRLAARGLAEVLPSERYGPCGKGKLDSASLRQAVRKDCKRQL